MTVYEVIQELSQFGDPDTPFSVNVIGEHIVAEDEDQEKKEILYFERKSDKCNILAGRSGKECVLEVEL